MSSPCTSCATGKPASSAPTEPHPVTDLSWLSLSADGRTLNQCYVEAASLEWARQIVRSRDGRKLRNRPVHVTLSGHGEFLTTVSPFHYPFYLHSIPS